MPRIPGPDDVSRVTARAVSDAAPNAGQDGQALAGVGRAVAGLSSVLRERRQSAEDAGFLSYLSENAPKAYDEVFEEHKPKADSGDQSFIESFDHGISSKQEEIVNQAIEREGYSPSAEARQRAQSYFASKKGAFLSKAATYENNIRVTKLKSQAERAIEGIRFNAFKDFDQLQTSLDEGGFLVESGRDLYSDPEAQKAAVKSDITKDAFLGLIERDPASALETLMAEEGPANRLDASTRIQLVNAAEREIDKINTRTKYDIKSRVEDAVAAYKQGIIEVDNPPSKAEFITAYGPENGSRLHNEFLGWQDIGETLSMVPMMSPEKVRRKLDDLNPANRPAGEGFAAESAQFAFIVNQVKAMEKRKQADPIKYIMQHDEEYRELFEKAQSDGLPMDSYVKAVMAEQERLGVIEPKLVPDNVAENIVSRFESIDQGGEMPAQVVEDLSQRWGKHWPALFRQISKDMPEAALVVASGIPKQAAILLSQNASVDDASLKGALEGTTARDIDEQITEDMVEFNQTMHGSIGKKSTASIIAHQTKRLAYLYAKSGASPEDAATRAYNEVVGDKYHFRGTYRVPKDPQYDIDIIEDSAQLAIEGMDLSNIAVRMPQGFESVPKEFLSEFTANAIRRNAEWVTNEDETGLILSFNGGALTRSDGSRIEVLFEDLMHKGEAEEMQRQKRILENLTFDE